MKTRLGTAMLALAVCAAAPVAQAGEILLTIDGGWYDMTNASNSAKALFGESGGLAGGARAGVRLHGDDVHPGRRPLLREGGRARLRGRSDRTRSCSSATRWTSRSSPLYALVGDSLPRGCAGCARTSPSAAARPSTTRTARSRASSSSFSTTKPMGMGRRGGRLRPRPRPVRARGRLFPGAGHDRHRRRVGDLRRGRRGRLHRRRPHQLRVLAPPLLERDQEAEALAGRGGEERPQLRDAVHQIARARRRPRRPPPRSRDRPAPASSLRGRSGRAGSRPGGRGQHLVGGLRFGRGSARGPDRSPRPHGPPRVRRAAGSSPAHRRLPPGR